MGRRAGGRVDGERRGGGAARGGRGGRPCACRSRAGRVRVPVDDGRVDEPRDVLRAGRGVRLAAGRRGRADGDGGDDHARYADWAREGGGGRGHAATLDAVGWRAGGRADGERRRGGAARGGRGGRPRAGRPRAGRVRVPVDDGRVDEPRDVLRAGRGVRPAAGRHGRADGDGVARHARHADRALQGAARLGPGRGLGGLPPLDAVGRRGVGDAHGERGGGAGARDLRGGRSSDGQPRAGRVRVPVDGGRRRLPRDLLRARGRLRAAAAHGRGGDDHGLHGDLRLRRAREARGRVRRHNQRPALHGGRLRLHRLLERGADGRGDDGVWHVGIRLRKREPGFRGRRLPRGGRLRDGDAGRGREPVRPGRPLRAPGSRCADPRGLRGCLRWRGTFDLGRTAVESGARGGRRGGHVLARPVVRAVRAGEPGLHERRLDERVVSYCVAELRAVHDERAPGDPPAPRDAHLGHETRLRIRRPATCVPTFYKKRSRLRGGRGHRRLELGDGDGGRRGRSREHVRLRRAGGDGSRELRDYGRHGQDRGCRCDAGDAGRADRSRLARPDGSVRAVFGVRLCRRIRWRGAYD